MSHGLNSSVLSVDVGTSGVRAALFDELGNQIEHALAVTRREPGDFIELDPDALVDEVVSTVDELLARPVAAGMEIEASAISTFWHSLVGVDGEGKATTALLTWADTRACKAAKKLRAEFDEREIHARTGCRRDGDRSERDLYVLAQ